jgi:hypothetical protein
MFSEDKICNNGNKKGFGGVIEEIGMACTTSPL